MKGKAVSQNSDAITRHGNSSGGGRRRFVRVAKFDIDKLATDVGQLVDRLGSASSRLLRHTAVLRGRRVRTSGSHLACLEEVLGGLGLGLAVELTAESDKLIVFLLLMSGRAVKREVSYA